MSETFDTSTYNLNHAKFGGGFAGNEGTQSNGTLNEFSSNQNPDEKQLNTEELQKIQAPPKTPLSNHLVCTICSRPNPNTSKFCIKCGLKLISFT